ncbi:ferritin-like domain-containing protein [Lentinula edodes]|uniref:Ferritin-like domain-containing protein n=1 Tax=Lentinula lateritia TaxID=40482 RepID=A0A9W9AZ43_9AGAR|nr:ferritin-like domain-containing protein [Lentinula edodes]
MLFSTTFLVMAVPLAVYAAPLRTTKRQVAAIDVTVLQFANTLEQLESQFYAAGLSKFQDSDFAAAGFTASSIAIQQITNIQSDEATHASILEEELTALGQNPNSTCSFNFDSALTDVTTMAATARVVENLGVMAYLGAASLLTDPQLLEAAGSILTVEARHQTILNVLSGTGTAIPSAFDLALTPSEVLAVASPFFSGTCDLGIPANPTLTVTNTGSVGQGTSLTFSSTAINSSVDTSTLFCQMMLGGNPFSISLPYNQCVVPSTVNGPVAIYVTSDDNPLQSNVVNRASANNILAGPTVAFIDAQPETLGQMVRSSGTGTASASSSTQTISPDVAASIVSAQGSSTAAGAAATDSSSVSATDSSAAAASTSNSVNDSSDPSAPFRDDFTGLAPGNAINVIGWSNIPSN